MEENILSKFEVIVERQSVPLIHAIKKHGFPPHFKFNNNDHESSKSEVESQQIDFTPEQYQTLLVLLKIQWQCF